MKRSAIEKLTSHLFNTIDKDDLDKVKWLIEKGADVNAKKDHSGETPLHIAAWNGKLPCMAYLIDKGADVNARNKDGWTPLHSAAWNNNPDAVIYLLMSEADIGIQCCADRTPLDFIKKYFSPHEIELIEAHLASKDEQERLNSIIQLAENANFIRF